MNNPGSSGEAERLQLEQQYNRGQLAAGMGDLRRVVPAGNGADKEDDAGRRAEGQLHPEIWKEAGESKIAARFNEQRP